MRCSIHIASATLLTSLVLLCSGCHQKRNENTETLRAEVTSDIDRLLARDAHDPKAERMDEQIIFNTLTSAGSSPLKVKGGAMTVFAQKKWQGNGTDANPDGSSAHPYCVSIDSADASYIIVNNLLGSDGLPVDPASINDVTLPLVIKIYGHLAVDDPPPGTRKRGDPSGNGIQLATQSQDCDGSHGSSILLTKIGQGGIYPIDLPAAGKRKGNKRFYDSTCYGVPNPAGHGDQDFCERMAKVELYYNGATTPNHTLTCPDGDCEIEVGSPQ